MSEIPATAPAASYADSQPPLIPPQLTEEQVLRNTSWRRLDDDIGCREMSGLYWQEDLYSSSLPWRIKSINDVVEQICQLWEGGVVNLVSFGAGGGLHELYVFHLLKIASIDATLTLIDPAYQDKEFRDKILSAFIRITDTEEITLWTTEQQYLNNINPTERTALSVILCIDRPLFKNPHALPENIIARAQREGLNLDAIKNAAIYPVGIAVEMQDANSLYCLLDRKENIEKLKPLADILKNGVKALASSSSVLFYMNGEGKIGCKPSLNPEVLKYLAFFLQITENATSLSELKRGFRKVLKQPEGRDLFSQYRMLVIPFADYDAGLINLVQQLFENSERTIVAELNNNHPQLHINVVK